MRLTRSQRFHTWSRWLSRSTQTGGVAYAAVLKADLSAFAAGASKVFGPGVEFLQSQSGWLTPLLLVAVPISAWAHSKIKDPALWSDVHDSLNQIRKEVFRDEPAAHQQYHRVTLFKHVNWYCSFRNWPWNGGWLVPVERSGHTTRRTHAVFRAPDDGELAHGIAGQVWSSMQTVYVPNLPDLRADSSPTNIASYSDMTFDNRKNLSACRARSLLGMHVEVKGKPWGVLVLDSVSTQIDKTLAEQIFTSIAPSLANILRRA